MAFGGIVAVRSVVPTALEIDVTGTINPTISIDPAYPGQTSFTELGTIVIGQWEATPVALQWGGTNNTLTAANGGIVYSDATKLDLLAPTATADQILLSGSNAAPSWSTATYPATTTVNQILYSSSANTIVGLATANNSILVTSSGGVPSLSQTIPTATQANITTVGTIGTGVWQGTAVGISYGGTGATSASVALSNLGALPLAGGTMTGDLILDGNPTVALQAATKQYVDAVTAGFTFLAAAYAGTTTNLNATYNNGAAGVGATLTNAGTQAAFTTDGTSPSINARILVNNQSTQFQNGIYSLTTVGSGSTNWVLTRTTDYNMTTEIVPGSCLFVLNGTLLTNTLWVETNTVTTIGTDPISFSQFAASGVESVSGTSNVITSTGGANPVINISASYVGQNSLVTLGTISTGTWHGTMIGLAYGGTNANLTASNGGIVYSTASALAILGQTATANQIILSGSDAAPSWSTATYPVTTTANQLLYSSATNTIVGLSTANNGVLITSGAGVPSISTTIPNATQLNITSLGTISTGVWNGTPITVPYGGTGNTTFTAYSLICAGTTATGTFQNVSGVGTSGQVLTSNGASALPTWQTSGSGSVTNIATSLGITGGPITSTGTIGLDFTVVQNRASVVAATTINLSATYSNGSSGVGATLTNSGAQAAFSLDGISPAINSRILVKNQSTALQNGIYTLTTVGNGSTNWVLTRATDFDGSITGGIGVGVIVWVESGTVNGQTVWMETAVGPFTVGTTSITFAGYAGQSSIMTVGTISSGIWQGTVLGSTYGGTGINNGSNTITIGGNISTANSFTTSGNNALTLTTTGPTDVTLPTSGTLVNTGVTSLSSLSGVGTITSGTWEGVTIGVQYGGTGDGSFTAYSVICGGTTSTAALQNVSGLGSSGEILTSNGSGVLPTWQTPANTGTVTDVTGAANQITVTNGTTTPEIFIASTYVGQTSITTLGTISSGTWQGTEVGVAYGGTGNGSFTSYSLICAGTTSSGAFQNVSGLGSSGQVLTSNGAASLPTWQPSGSGSVSSVGSGYGLTGGPITSSGSLVLDLTVLTQRTVCLVATTASLTVIYNNGSSGIGATLTNNGSQSVFTLDGDSPALGSRVLVKNQSSAFQNGIYTLTNAGSGSSNWVLTRASDFDGSINGGIAFGVTVWVGEGTVNAETVWMQTASGPFSIGTTSITFAGYAGQASLVSLGTITTGVWNGTTIAVANGGTGNTTFTSYGVLCAGTTSTGAFQNVSGVGSSGQVLTSNGAGALPTWQTGASGTVTSVSGTAGQIDVATGTTTPVISIDSGYVGQTSITTLGTIGTGTWQGNSVALAHGGTNANLTASNGGIFYSTASAGAILAGTSTALQMLQSGASTTPAWSTTTWPATSTINQILYSSSANTIAGLATANNGVLITSSGGVPSISSTLPTGVQTNITELGTITTGVWTGTTIAVANGGTGNTTFTAYSVLCAGTTSTGAFQNVSGVGSSGQVLTSNGASALPTWQSPAEGLIVNQNTSTVTMSAGSQYFINNGATLVTLTLPSTAALGDTYTIVGGSSGGWKIAQNASQQIHCDGTATTSGTGGSLASTGQYQNMTIKCITANTTFTVFDAVGSITVV